MNERIRELDAQSLVKSEGQWVFSKEKFAELIVQECINTVQTFRTRMDASNDDIVVALKERFGVKE